MLYDLLLGDEGRTLLYMPFLNWGDGNLDVARELLTHEFTVPGLSDGGAHAGMICDASFPTFLLTHWTRDRTRGDHLDIADVVRRQCRSTAEAVGLLDRGLLAPGHRGDLNVIDFDNLQIGVGADRPRPARRRQAPRAAGVRLRAHDRRRRRDVPRRRADRCAARPAGSRPADAICRGLEAVGSRLEDHQVDHDDGDQVGDADPGRQLRPCGLAAVAERRADQEPTHRDGGDPAQQ